MLVFFLAFINVRISNLLLCHEFTIKVTKFLFKFQNLIYELCSKMVNNFFSSIMMIRINTSHLTIFCTLTATYV